MTISLAINVTRQHFNLRELQGFLPTFFNIMKMFTCSANHKKALKMLHHKLSYETIFSITFSNYWLIDFDQLGAGSSYNKET